jgi:hypothetical protein
MKSIKTNIMRILLAGGLLTAFFSCGEDKLTDRIGPNVPAPSPIDKNSVTVKNLPGRAILHYRVPQDENLLYVKAVYTTAPGITREAKASLYIDSLLVEGFAEAGEYTVKLYSVGRNEKESEPVSVTVTPETPPVVSSGETLGLIATFGGVAGSFQNESKTPLIAVLQADTSHTGLWTQLRAFSLNDVQSSFNFVELTDTMETDFRVYLKDRYGNVSAPKDFRLKPWYNEKIPKKTWLKYTLASDFTTAAESESRYGLAHLWDEISNQVDNNIFASANAGPSFPYHFTIKLGMTARISRLQLHHRLNYEYSNKTPKKWELWGSESDLPDDNLFGGDWFLIGRFTSFMPSGSTGAPTAEDKLYANGEGERLMIQPTDEIPDPYRPVKFIRLRVFEVWDNSQAGQVIIAEIDLYGQIIK